MYILIIILIIAYYLYHTIYYYESNKDYINIRLPFIKKNIKENTKWIDKMFHTNHPDVIYRYDEFILAKDRKSINNKFYILAIPRKQIYNIRHLTKQDIPILLDMKRAGINYAKSIGIDKLKIFFHYIPSIYQLHLHFCAEDHNMVVEDASYYLDDVIKGLEKDSSYWWNYEFKIKYNVDDV